MSPILSLTPLASTGPTTAQPCTDKLPNGVPLTVDRDARLFRESLTRCRRDVSSPITDARIKNLTKKIDSGRAQPGRLVIEAMYDAFVRGAPQVDVEAPARTLLALVQSWYASTHQSQLDLLALVRAETIAESEANPGEMELVLDPSRKTIADAAEKLDAHLAALEKLSAACHRRLVA
jgi:hypothetical protein